MKNHISFNFWMLLIVSALFSSCKKDKSTNVASSLEFEKTQYYPMEAAQINTNGLTLSQASYVGSIDGVSYTVSVYQGSLVLIMPNLSAGDYNLKLQINGKEYSAGFQLLSTPKVVNVNPQAVINTEVFSIDAHISQLQTIAAGLSGTSQSQLQADIDWLTRMRTNIQHSLDTLSDAEKINCAMVIKANSGWINETLAAIDSFQVNSVNLRLMSDVEDFDQKVDRSVTNYLKPLFTLFVKNTPKILALTATGAVLGSEVPVIGNGIGAVIGFGIGLSDYLTDAKKLLAAEGKVLNVELEPLNDLNTENLRTSSTLNYINNIPSTLSITNDYRSTYKNDRSSTVPIIKDIVTYTDGVASLYNELNNLLPEPLSYDAPVIDDNTTYSTTNREVHSNYLTITGISNSNVTVSTQTQGGRIVATFKTTQLTDQDFTYTVQYNNIRFGSYSQTVNAHLKVGGTVTDIDGNVYHTRFIGTQEWMIENLKTSHYNDGSEILNVTDNSQWYSSSPDAYCYYNNDANNNATYGKLYNWYAVNTGKLAPTGWHVPTDAEWTTLVNYLGGDVVAGSTMKTSSLWTSPNTGATNSSGFTALPAGTRADYGGFGEMGNLALFWSSTNNTNVANQAWIYYLAYNATNALRYSYYYKYGLSVRCVKD